MTKGSKLQKYSFI